MIRRMGSRALSRSISSKVLANALIDKGIRITMDVIGLQSKLNLRISRSTTHKQALFLANRAIHFDYTASAMLGIRKATSFAKSPVQLINTARASVRSGAPELEYEAVRIAKQGAHQIKTAKSAKRTMKWLTDVLLRQLNTFKTAADQREYVLVHNAATSVKNRWRL